MEQLRIWLNDVCHLDTERLIPLAGDASFRRYFRLPLQNQSYVVMDASKERQSCVPYAAISAALRQQGLMTPKIFAHNFAEGFLLLTDFGDDLYLKKLTAENVQPLYERATDALAILHQTREVKNWQVPLFTAEFMLQELQLFKQWFVHDYRKLSLTAADENKLTADFQKIVTSAANQPQVFMHRDYHSANLMVLPDNQVGILDFQDAFMGPVTYDLVSLLRDCYITWPDEIVTALAVKYCEKINLTASTEEFLHWFDWMGLQRQMKALLTFSRKFLRDHNPDYLQHVPRTLNYLLNVSARYPELKNLNHFVKILCEP